MTVAHWLKNLSVREVSLVDAPANPGARILLTKRGEPVKKDMYGVSRFAELIGSIGYLLQSAESEAEFEGDRSPVPAALRAWLKQGLPVFRAMSAEETEELINAMVTKRKFSAADRRTELSDTYKSKTGMISRAMDFFKSFGSANARLADSVKSIVEDDSVADKAAMIDKTIEQFSDHIADEVEKALSTGNVDEHGEDDEMSPAIKKALGLADTATDDEALAIIAKMNGEAEIAKAGMSDDEKSFHDGMKDDDAKKSFRALSRDERKGRMKKRDDDLPEHVKKQLSDAEDLRKRLETIEGERDLAQFQKRAVAMGLPEAAGETLMKARKGDAAAWDKVEAMLKGLSTQVETGVLFKEFGDNRGGGGVDAKGEIMAKATELRKARPELTIEKAKALVISDKANVDLVKRYNEEERARINKSRAA